jgi:hypothetical protein
MAAWPRYGSASGWPVMHIEKNAHSAPDANRARYEFLDANAPFRAR